MPPANPPATEPDGRAGKAPARGVFTAVFPARRTNESLPRTTHDALGLNTGSHRKLKCVLWRGCQVGPRDRSESTLYPTGGAASPRASWASRTRGLPSTATALGQHVTREVPPRLPYSRGPRAQRATARADRAQVGQVQGPHSPPWSSPGPAHQAHSACSPHSNLGPGAPGGSGCGPRPRACEPRLVPPRDAPGLCAHRQTDEDLAKAQACEAPRGGPAERRTCFLNSEHQADTGDHGRCQALGPRTRTGRPGPAPSLWAAGGTTLHAGGRRGPLIRGSRWLVGTGTGEPHLCRLAGHHPRQQ